MKNLAICSVIILALFCSKINAQYNFTNYTNKDDIQSLKVEGDSIWIGTTGGLVLRNIDGTLIETLTLNDGLASNFINSIFIDIDGIRWVTGEDRAVTNDADGWSEFDYSSSDNRTTTGEYIYGSFSEMTQDQDSNIWFAGWNSIYKYQKDGLYENHSDSLSLRNITTITVDADNNVWVGQNWEGYSGPYMYDGSKWTDFTGSPGLLSSRIKSIKVKEDIVWFGTISGLTKYDGNEFITYTKDSGLVYQNVEDIAFDNDTLWISTSQGVSKFDGSSWTSYYSNIDLPFYGAITVTVDSNGNKWFGSEKGLYKFDNNLWTRYSISNELIYNSVRSLAIDHNGVKWFSLGSYNNTGLTRFDGTTWDTIAKGDGLLGYVVNTIAIDDDGNKWVGTNEGIEIYDDNTFTYFLSDSGYPTGGTNAITFQEDTVWIASWEGLTKYYDDTWQTYTTADGLLAGILSPTIAIDLEGNIWGGYDGTYSISGVFRLSGDLITNYTEIDEFNWVTPSDIVVDKDSNVWVAASNLYKFDGETWIRDGASCGNSESILIDSIGNFWIGHNNGLLHYDGTYSVNNSNEDGFVSSDNVFSLAQESDGSIWAATDDGVSHIEFVKPIPSFEVSKLCYGDTSVFVNTSLEANILTQIQWDINNDGTIESTQHEFEYRFPSVGTYQVKMIADNMGFKDSIIRNVEYLPIPSYSVATNDTLICWSDSIDIFEISGITPLTIYISNDTIIAEESPYAYYSNYSAFLQSIEDANGCSLEEINESVTLSTYGEPQAGLSVQNYICGDDSISFTFNTSLDSKFPLSIIYTNGTDLTTLILNESQKTFYIHDAGNYSIVEITDSIGCKSKSLYDTINVIAYPKPSAQITSSADTICQGDSALISINLIGTPPWSIVSSFGNLDSLNQEDNPIEFYVNDGSQTIVYDINDSSNCYAGDLGEWISVHVLTLPSAYVSANDNSICEGDTVIIYLSLSGAPPFDFTYTGGEMTDVTQSNPISLEVLVIDSFYITSLTDTTGCVAVELGDTLLIPIIPAPTVTITADETDCSDTTAMVSFEFTGTPLWWLKINENGELNYFGTEENPLIMQVLSGTKYELIALHDENNCYALDTGVRIIIEEFGGPIANFSTEANGLDLTFTNLSRAASSYNWDFGNGNTSIEENPSISYLEEGNYVVTLVAISDSCGTDTFSDNFYVYETGTYFITGSEIIELKLYPNPNTGLLYIDFEGIITDNIILKITDLNGRLIVSEEYNNIENSVKKINLSDLNNGIYIIEIRNSEIFYRAKLVIR